jgi:hypothetical protein
MDGLLIQRIHPALTIGQRLTLSGSKVGVHSAQGTWDSGCAFHCTSIALAMLGLLRDPARVPVRRSGIEARLWSEARAQFFHGIALNALQDLLHELDAGVRAAYFEGQHEKVRVFCEAQVSRGRPVIVSWHLPSRSALHAVLVVGIEGRMRHRKFQPQTLLVLDPGEGEPWMTASNARISFDGAKKRGQATYVTDNATFAVTLTGALSIRTVARQGKR